MSELTASYHQLESKISISQASNSISWPQVQAFEESLVFLDACEKRLATGMASNDESSSFHIFH